MGWVVTLTQAAVVPIYIHGSRERGPQWRDRPGVTVVVGKPIPSESLIPPGLRGRELYQAISDRILEAIRELSLSTPYGRVTEKAPIRERDTISDERLR